MARTTPIGILGGSFDPVHNGHLAIAQLACEYFKLDTVLFVPASIPPHKSDTVRGAASDRLAMLELAIGKNPSFEAWDIELRRPGKSYTVDTIELLQERYPDREPHFIIGSDNLKEIPTWHRYRRMLSLMTLCVTHRPGHSMQIPPQLGSARIRTFPSPEWALSSSQVRGLLKRGHCCRYLLPDKVLDYIKNQALYR